MSLRRAVLLISLALVALIALGQSKTPEKSSAPKTAGSVMIVEPGMEKWGDIPAAALVGTPSVEMGGKMQVAMLQGDPMTAGRSYTLRLSCADGVKIAPHWHPTTENVTVMKGGAAVGMGPKWDPALLKDVPTGGFFTAAPHMTHFAQCKGDSILQVHGVGPFVLNFVGPGEDQPAKQ
jgi:hypothetical protein